eukprot:Phypoly_transcript_09432.p1 GENE.Phypoly_transcript_09432~~Phypoly_transcript_09432.p1  ORF type:complete len:432 (+),score=79.98 Phypoly_transcript_09432:33-1298(+)
MEVRIPFFPPMFFVFKPSYIKRILSVEADNFQTSGDQGAMFRCSAFSGKNVLLTHGPPHSDWLKYRELSTILNKDRFGEDSLVGQMVMQTWKSLQELAQNHFGSKLGKPIDLYKELFEVIIPAHNHAMFGEESTRKFQYKELNFDMYDIEAETGKLMYVPYVPPTNKSKVYFAQMRSVAQAFGNMAKNSQSKFMAPFLDAFRKGNITEEELVSNISIYGYAQAPLHVVFWLLYVLAVYPEEEKKVVAEISSVLAQGPLTYERMAEFKYLSKCIAESMRIYPGVGMMQVRTTQQSTQFGAHFIPEKSYVILCQYMIQRNATYYPQPDEFNPNREGLDPSQYGENLSYIPFGSGPRQCQGQFYAQDFVKTAMVSFLQNYKLSIVPGQKPPQPTELGFMRPVDPFYFQLEKRDLSPATSIEPNN